MRLTALKSRNWLKYIVEGLKGRSVSDGAIKLKSRYDQIFLNLFIKTNLFYR